jgi:hypothetical protein
MAGLVPAISVCLKSRVDAQTENPLAEKFLATRDLCTGVQNECDLLNTCFADRGA